MPQEMTDELFTPPTGEDVRAGVLSLAAGAGLRAVHGRGHADSTAASSGCTISASSTCGPGSSLGGNGAFLDLDGLDGIKGMYVLEIPGGQALNPERHLYHEFYLVIEGRGTTETWVRDADRKQITEWQPGSLFYFPPNVNHRLVNATNERVLIIADDERAADLNIIRDRDFIFNNDFDLPAALPRGRRLLQVRREALHRCR